MGKMLTFYTFGDSYEMLIGVKNFVLVTKMAIFVVLS